MSSATLPAIVGPNGSALMATQQPQGINAVRETMETLKAIRTFVKEEMVEGLDFGVIPGTGQKPALLQPGAQKTALYFNATPDHQIERMELGNGHVEFLITTRLVSRSTGVVVGMGLGSCATMEKKYRYRNSSRKCPACGAEAIINGNAEWNNGVPHFLCHKKRGGCGAKFAENNPDILRQTVGQAENPDIYDARNTVLKMAVKRSFVAAALSLGCLSELFTQDIDETYDITASEAPRPAQGHAERAGDGRREVNETFQRKSVPRDEDADPMPQKTPQAPSWASYAARTCNERRDYWHNELAIANVPQADRVRAENLLPDQHQLVNHFVTHAITAGALKAEDVSKDGTPEGPRDPAKAKAAMADLFRRAPKRIAAAVDAYFHEKERGLRVRLGMDDLIDETTGQDAAEEVSQEAVAGREPGSDDDR